MVHSTTPEQNVTWRQGMDRPIQWESIDYNGIETPSHRQIEQFGEFCLASENDKKKPHLIQCASMPSPFPVKSMNVIRNVKAVRRQKLKVMKNCD
jgi:hypothetical protein